MYIDFTNDLKFETQVFFILDSSFPSQSCMLMFFNFNEFKENLNKPKRKHNCSFFAWKTVSTQTYKHKRMHNSSFFAVKTASSQTKTNVSIADTFSPCKRPRLKHIQNSIHNRSFHPRTRAATHTDNTSNS